MTLTAAFVQTPPRQVQATWNGQRLEGEFQVRARFGGEESSRGRYKQLVRGRFLVDGTLHPHRLCDNQWLSATEFREDGCPAPPCTAFGDRACPNYDTRDAQDVYSPDRMGPDFHMLDRPGLGAAAGSRVQLDLEFLGLLIDQDSGHELARHEWRVQGEAMVPHRMASQETTRVKASGRLIHVELAGSARDGWTGTVFVSGRDRLDGHGGVMVPRLKFQVTDALGIPLTISPEGTGRIVETGSPRNRTWALSFQLVGGQADPARLLGGLDDEGFTVELGPK
ncbi:MAG: hypothetical protein V4773_04010 [Verrucomicrobiota bacterium]